MDEQPTVSANIAVRVKTGHSTPVEIQSISISKILRATAMLLNDFLKLVKRSTETQAQPSREIADVRKLHEPFNTAQPNEPIAVENVEAITVKACTGTGDSTPVGVYSAEHRELEVAPVVPFPKLLFSFVNVNR